MNFMEFKQGYFENNAVKQYPSIMFIQEYINTEMKTAVGTEDQLKKKS